MRWKRGGCSFGHRAAAAARSSKLAERATKSPTTQAAGLDGAGSTESGVQSRASAVKGPPESAVRTGVRRPGAGVWRALASQAGMSVSFARGRDLRA